MAMWGLWVCTPVQAVYFSSSFELSQRDPPINTPRFPSFHSHKLSQTLTTTASSLTKSQPQPTTMKSSILALTVALALATSAVAVPQLELEKRDDNCFFASHCSATWYGKCENHCGDRKFSHMSGDGCGWFKKRCCCISP